MFSTTALLIGLAVLVLGFLLLRFVIKTAITLVKVALLVAIAVGVWLGVQQLM
ncbi:MAG: hypothetical protein ACPGQL_10115 [Thermoplasmatota archaeon]